MIATITVQHPHKVPPKSDAHYSRHSNQAGRPLPIIPRRTTRSQSLPTSKSSVQRPVISAPLHHWNQNALDSDSSSSNSSETLSSTSRTRKKRVKGVRSGASSPPKAISSSSPIHLPAAPIGQICQSQSRQGVLAEDVPVIVAPRPLVYTPGTLRLSLETMRSHMLAEPNPFPHDPRSVAGNGSKSAPPHGSKSTPSTIRKKSGQPVKSSLKSSRCTRGNLSVITIGTSSKSEPPTPKVVHFDPQLERVKLFLAEQKPLAVSRDGSPTDDTSGTDSDFPSFIYGDDDDTCQRRKKLVMRPINLVPKTDANAQVALEDFYLNFDGTNILGKVRVRNIAFTKTVAVRFTFDSWQTTSEVTARYAESIDPQLDRFSFSIRLNDLLARIEGKTFMMAIRYNVAGQEFWDNNHCQDYVATFTKAKVARESRKSDDEDAGDVELESLRSRLEQVVLHGKDKHSNTAALPKSSSPPQLKETDPPSLRSGIALSSRYDFATSLRNPTAWRSTDLPARTFPPKDSQSLSPPSRRSRSTTVPALPSSIPWPEKRSPPNLSATLPPVLPSLKGHIPPLVSPRDFDEECLFAVPRISVAKEDEIIGSSLTPRSERCRNHRRSYSADGGLIGVSSAVRRTPPGKPTSKPSELDGSSQTPIPPAVSRPLLSSRCHSFPPLTTHCISPSSPLSSPSGHDRIGQLTSSPPIAQSLASGLGLNLGESGGDSDLSTPSLSTPTSSRSPTPSPTDPFVKSVLPLLCDDAFYPSATYRMLRPMEAVSPGTHYRQFLNKFCFFTGSSLNAGEDAASSETIYSKELLHSWSDIFASAAAAKLKGSLDDLALSRDDSGASTPTISGGKWGSRAATPVPP